MSRLFAALVLVAASALAGDVAHAQAPSDPDLEIAHGHFVRGSSFYQQSRYRDAIQEFEAAKAAKPLPDLDYNIARCYEQMGSLDEAIAHYETYLGESKSNGPEILETRAHLEVLKRRRAEEKARPQPAPTPSAEGSPTATASPGSDEPIVFRHHIGPIALGGLAIATAAVGAILVGTVVPKYNALARGGSMACEPNCPESSWKLLQAQAWAGDALLIAGGVLAAADVALWVVDLRRKRPEPTATSPATGFYVVPSGPGLVAGGRF